MSVSSLWSCLALVLLCPAATGQEVPFQKVLNLLSPGQSALNSTAVADLIRRLEDRVQCGKVSCEKVRPEQRDSERDECKTSEQQRAKGSGG